MRPRETWKVGAKKEIMAEDNPIFVFAAERNCRFKPPDQGSEMPL